jgi:serine/threonine-protein kinase
VALQHVRDEPAPLAALRPDLPPALCAVVHKMMAKAPEARYQTGRELLRDVVRVRESLSGATAALSPASAGATVATAALLPAPAAPATAPMPTARPRWRRPALLFVLSVLLAGLAGAAVARYRRAAADPLRHPEGPPADAAEVEALAPAHRREKALREAAEEYLSAPDTKRVAVGYGLCLDLALLYLEADRLDEAEKFFTRLDGVAAPPQYHLLGHLGRGVVLALRDQPEGSNRYFAGVYGVRRFVNQTASELVKRKQDGAVQILQNPQWRFWMNKALAYNARNGLPEEKVPAGLQKLLPLKK